MLPQWEHKYASAVLSRSDSMRDRDERSIGRQRVIDRSPPRKFRDASHAKNATSRFFAGDQSQQKHDAFRTRQPDTPSFPRPPTEMRRDLAQSSSAPMPRLTVVPVNPLAWSEATNAAAFATSSSVMTRLVCVVPARKPVNCSTSCRRVALDFEDLFHGARLRDPVRSQANHAHALTRELERKISRELLLGGLGRALAAVGGRALARRKGAERHDHARLVRQRAAGAQVTAASSAAEGLELAGFQMHASKPVEPSRLVSLVANLTGLSIDSSAAHESGGRGGRRA